jgi:hypothetical protein
MRNSPEDQDDRRHDAPAEPPADLLRRALSHVEDLLGRLEYPTVKHDDLPDLSDDQDGLDILTEEPREVAAAEPTAALAARPDEPAPAELSDPGQPADQQARGMAESILEQARRDADAIRAEGRAEAELLVQEAAVEAERMLAAAEARAQHRLVATDGDLQRPGPDDGAARAFRDRRAAAADRVQARDMLDNARFALTGVRSEVQALREALLFSVGSIESAERAIDALLETSGAVPASPRAADTAPSADAAPTTAESAATR